MIATETEVLSPQSGPWPGRTNQTRSMDYRNRSESLCVLIS